MGGKRKAFGGYGAALGVRPSTASEVAPHGVGARRRTRAPKGRSPQSVSRQPSPRALLPRQTAGQPTIPATARTEARWMATVSRMSRP